MVCVHKGQAYQSISSMLQGASNESRLRQMFAMFFKQHVVVEAEGYTVKGKLVYYSPGERQNHIPDSLILENQHGFIILRSWSVIKK